MSHVSNISVLAFLCFLIFAFFLVPCDIAPTSKSSPQLKTVLCHLLVRFRLKNTTLNYNSFIKPSYTLFSFMYPINPISFLLLMWFSCFTPDFCYISLVFFTCFEPLFPLSLSSFQSVILSFLLNFKLSCFVCCYVIVVFYLSDKPPWTIKIWAVDTYEFYPHHRSVDKQAWWTFSKLQESKRDCLLEKCTRMQAKM